MVTLAAYLDESIGPRTMSVAGWIASSEKWERYHRNWSSRLQREGVDVLGSSDIEAAQRAPFKDWGAFKREAVLTECVEDIADGVLACVGVSVVFDDFYAALSEVGMNIVEQRHRDQNCYALSAIACVLSVATWVGQTDKHVLITFESGMKGFGKVERWLRHLQKHETEAGRVTLVSPPKSKREVIELQGADFFARESMLHASQIAASPVRAIPDPSAMRSLHLALLMPFRGRTGDILGGYWDKDKIVVRLREMLSHDQDSRFNRSLLAGYDADDD